MSLFQDGEVSDLALEYKRDGFPDKPATGIIQMVLLPVPDMQIWKLIRMETGGWFVWESVPLVLHSEV